MGLVIDKKPGLDRANGIGGGSGQAVCTTTRERIGGRHSPYPLASAPGARRLGYRGRRATAHHLGLDGQPWFCFGDPAPAKFW